jgi:uncharacterized protein (TIGR02594 family)
MWRIVWTSFAVLAVTASFFASAQAKPLRSFAVTSCSGRYLDTCGARAWQRKAARRHRTSKFSHEPHQQSSFAGSAEPAALVDEARRWIGTNPTGKPRLWCARFMNFILGRLGLQGTGSDLAMSFRHYGRSISGPQVGAIAVLARRGGGHVGVVSGIDANGNPIIISGNHGRRVGEGIYSRSRVVAYVMP